MPAGNPEKTGSGRTGCPGVPDRPQVLGSAGSGFLLYYGMWSVVCGAAGVEKRRVEGIPALRRRAGELLGLWQEANVSYVRGLFDSSGVLGPLVPILHALLLMGLCWRLIALLADQEMALSNKLLLTGLVCLLPTALNAVDILMAGSATQLMSYGGRAFVPASGGLLGASGAPAVDGSLAQRGGGFIVPCFVAAYRIRQPGLYEERPR